jgi:hypothetical protein
MFSGCVVVVYLRVVGVVFSRCGGWYPVSHTVQSGVGTSRFIGYQVLFCTYIDASVSLASLDGDVRTVPTV